MDALLNGAPVMAADAILPYEGRWTADVRTDVAEVPEPGAAAVLRLLGRDYQGVVVAAGSVGGSVHVRLVGGRGGLDRQLSAKHYRNAPTVGLVLQDLLQEAGEQLAATADQDVLSTPLEKWTRTAAQGLDLLAELVTRAGALWRVQADGSTWVGRDTWAPVSADWTLISGSLEAGRLTIAAEELPVDPGQTLDGLRVRALVHLVRPESSRTTLILDQAAPPNPLNRIVDRWLRRRGYDYARPQPGKAVTQDADGTLQVQLDDPAYPPMTGVGIRSGLPGTTVKIAPGARVLVEWEAGDPGGPVVTAWGTSAAQEVSIGTEARGVARLQDTVSAATSMASWISAVNAALLGLGVTVAPPGDFGLISSGSSVLKAGD